MTVKIQSLIDEAVQRGVFAWIEYPEVDGFTIKVGYVGKEELLKMTDQAKKTVWSKHRKEEQMDRTKLTRMWAKRGILDWSGLTLGKLKQIIPISVSPEDESKEVICDEDNKFALLFNSTEFDVWLTEVTTSPELFADEMKKREGRVGELKNS